MSLKTILYLIIILALIIIGLCIYLVVRKSNPSTQTSNPQPSPTQEIKFNSGKPVTVYANKPWQDSGLEAKPGQTIRITTTGSISWDPQLPTVGPSGTSYAASTRQQPEDFPLPQATCGTLLVRIGGTMHIAGIGTQITTQTGGVIEFMVNDRWTSLKDNSGTFNANVELSK